MHKRWVLLLAALALSPVGVGIPTACGADLYVGRGLASGGLPGEVGPARAGDLVDAGPSTSGTFTGSWRTAALGVGGLSAFERITGDLVVDSPGLESLVLFDLVEVGGDLVLCDAAALTNVTLSQLGAVGGSLLVCRDPALATLTLPELNDVGGDLLLDELDALSFVDLDQLMRVGGRLTLDEIGALTFAAPGLSEIGGDLVIGGVAPRVSPLATVELEALTHIGRSLEVVRAPTLRTLRLGALTEIDHELLLLENPELFIVDLDQLMRVGGGGCLCDNPRWPTCAAEQIEAAAGPAPDAGVVFEIRGNDDDGTCSGG